MHDALTMTCGMYLLQRERERDKGREGRERERYPKRGRTCMQVCYFSIRIR